MAEIIQMNRISWPAIFAGVIVGLAAQALLNLLGLGLGLIAFSPDPNVAGKVGIGAITWLLLSGVIAMGIGGWLVGRMAQTRDLNEAALHAIIMWSLAALVTFVLATTTVGVITGAAINMVGRSMVITEGASSALGGFALVSFFMMLVGAVAAVVSARKGATQQ